MTKRVANYAVVIQRQLLQRGSTKRMGPLSLEISIETFHATHDMR
jgi:hypothetical protein